jgi:lipoprotein-anchoring transpeptidase ErfK/SrfK
MRVPELIIVSCILALSGVGVAFLEPSRVVGEGRGDRLERDRRSPSETAAQPQKGDRTAQADLQHRLYPEPDTTGTIAPGPDAQSTQRLPSSARQIAPEAPGPAASSAGAATGSAASNPRSGPSALGAAASPNSTEPASGVPSFGQPGASSGREDPKVLFPATPTTDHDGPGAAQPAASSSRDAAEPVAPPTPRVLITVDKATQRMRVTVDGKLRYSWPVSTGRPHYDTPSGTFRPLWLARVHYSKEWDHAPMPHSIFFTEKGHAIHATNATRQLGRRASHGCVRLAPSKAAALFALIRAEGPSVTQVTVTGGATARKSARSRTVEARARR